MSNKYKTYLRKIRLFYLQTILKTKIQISESVIKIKSVAKVIDKYTFTRQNRVYISIIYKMP